MTLWALVDLVPAALTVTYRISGFCGVLGARGDPKSVLRGLPRAPLPARNVKFSRSVVGDHSGAPPGAQKMIPKMAHCQCGRNRIKALAQREDLSLAWTLAEGAEDLGQLRVGTVLGNCESARYWVISGMFKIGLCYAIVLLCQKSGFRAGF